jgi:hypothetical protein
LSPGVALSEAAAAYRRAAGILERAYGEDHEATVEMKLLEQSTRLQLTDLRVPLQAPAFQPPLD